MPPPQINNPSPPLHRELNAQEPRRHQTHQKLPKVPPPINQHRHVDNNRPPLLLEPTAGEIMTQSKSGKVCTIPSTFSALDLAPLNVRLSWHIDN